MNRAFGDHDERLSERADVRNSKRAEIAGLIGSTPADSLPDGATRDAEKSLDQFGADGGT
ncbi:hypothetical protein D3Y57_17120 [Sphingomonas paeninsulae]|uniref:Uncharacterized protein n=1 Tax=Sphingomonas paeninsulae TaxID=2319844 RepID=A0A494TNF4_SPHPE|nr:hypothetical protein D3Y57_17120 [Sphingomonas paeninsulae]